jgi:hypothetical protein
MSYAEVAWCGGVCRQFGNQPIVICIEDDAKNAMRVLGMPLACPCCVLPLGQALVGRPLC